MIAEILQIGLLVVAALGIFAGAIVIVADLASEAFIAALVVVSLGYLTLAVRTGARIGAGRSELRRGAASGDASQRHKWN